MYNLSLVMIPFFCSITLGRSGFLLVTFPIMKPEAWSYRTFPGLLDELGPKALNPIRCSVVTFLIGFLRRR